MPSRRSQEMLELIRSHKKLASNVSNGMLMKINAPAEQVAKMRVSGTRAKLVEGLDMPAVMIEPKEIRAENAVLMHMHGGAYVSGGLLQCRALISPICAEAGIRALTFSYRLAPQYPYPAQLEDAYRAYQFLLHSGYPAKRIGLVGESAGGNLALELTLRLRAEGEALPGALALLSPWTDLKQTGESYQTLKDADATLNGEELMKSAIDFAGSEERLASSEISPLFNSFKGFPPTLIHCGTREILLSDSEKLEEAMLRDGVDAHLVRWEGMCHVFQAFGFEESKAANHQLGTFLYDHLKDH
ncbi:MAG: alpha/beta hydrolase [Clostridia bacterium]|nr:alpha/beta hydrolase [Clostridia bacterium]